MTSSLILMSAHELCREAGSRDVPVVLVCSKRLIAEKLPRGVAAREV